MTLTYAQIAEWIGPVADYAGIAAIRLGSMCLIRMGKGNEYANGRGVFTPPEWADLAQCELVRRLNEKGYEVAQRKGAVQLVQWSSCWRDEHTYTTHPLEAVARFVREVGA